MVFIADSVLLICSRTLYADSVLLICSRSLGLSLVSALRSLSPKLPTITIISSIFNPSHLVVAISCRHRGQDHIYIYRFARVAAGLLKHIRRFQPFMRTQILPPTFCSLTVLTVRFGTRPRRGVWLEKPSHNYSSRSRWKSRCVYRFLERA